MRTALVTGGGSGIGKATAAVLAGAGMQVVIAGRDKATLQAAAAEIGSGVGVHAADVTRPEDRERLVGACRDCHGGIDVLVNAATVTAIEPLLDYAQESWSDVLAINLDACFFLAQLAIEDMRPRSWGRIVNVGSVYGQVALDNRLYRERLPEDVGGRGPAREIAYAAAKGGVRQLTRELAVACARWGITVNTVVPGMFPPDPAAVPEAMRERILERIPVGRFGEPEEVGHAIEFLASDRAAYVTGSELLVDGGWTTW
jgi:NAD(P)-dependent dehydrogenase (short-subunit alcohol dehydrogenase family)